MHGAQTRLYKEQEKPDAKTKSKHVGDGSFASVQVVDSLAIKTYAMRIMPQSLMVGETGNSTRVTALAYYDWFGTQFHVDCAQHKQNESPDWMLPNTLETTQLSPNASPSIASKQQDYEALTLKKRGRAMDTSFFTEVAILALSQQCPNIIRLQSFHIAHSQVTMRAAKFSLSTHVTLCHDTAPSVNGVSNKSLMQSRSEQRHALPLSDCNEMDALIMTRDLCLGLFFLHSHNVVHADVKPDNVLYYQSTGKHSRWTLCDFNISIMLSPTRDAFHNFTTPCVSPPEQRCGVPFLPSFDMWSLAITLIHYWVPISVFEQTVSSLWTAMEPPKMPEQLPVIPNTKDALFNKITNEWYTKRGHTMHNEIVRTYTMRHIVEKARLILYPLIAQYVKSDTQARYLRAMIALPELRPAAADVLADINKTFPNLAMALPRYTSRPGLIPLFWLCRRLDPPATDVFRPEFETRNCKQLQKYVSLESPRQDDVVSASVIDAYTDGIVLVRSRRDVSATRNIGMPERWSYEWTLRRHQLIDFLAGNDCHGELLLALFEFTHVLEPWLRRDVHHDAIAWYLWACFEFLLILFGGSAALELLHIEQCWPPFRGVSTQLTRRHILPLLCRTNDDATVQQCLIQIQLFWLNYMRLYYAP